MTLTRHHHDARRATRKQAWHQEARQQKVSDMADADSPLEAFCGFAVAGVGEARIADERVDALTIELRCEAADAVERREIEFGQLGRAFGIFGARPSDGGSEGCELSWQLGPNSIRP